LPPASVRGAAASLLPRPPADAPRGATHTAAAVASLARLPTAASQRSASGQPATSQRSASARRSASRRSQSRGRCAPQLSRHARAGLGAGFALAGYTIQQGQKATGATSDLQMGHGGAPAPWQVHRAELRGGCCLSGRGRRARALRGDRGSDGPTLPQDQGPPRAAAAHVFDRAVSRFQRRGTICSLGGAHTPTYGEQIALHLSNAARGGEQTTPQYILI
jgi:hypothetical protein